jgi:hypothetical protein
MKKVNNYKFQQEQQRKQQHQKMLKLKEKIEKTPVSASEELDYIKKLLNGEDVEDFGPKEVKHDRMSEIEYWSAGVQPVFKAPWLSLTLEEIHKAAQMSLSDYLTMMRSKEYYK